MSTLSRGMYLSKGKWIPGMKPDDSVSQYFCDVCDRGFANDSSLQKHLASELHFKRRAKNDGKSLRKNNDLFDETFPSNREKRKRNNSPVVRVEKNGQQTIYCPTCFSKVDKLLMGKHLISHFHCQKVSRKDRQVNPERNLILEHIHQIASQSPFQCGPCKYYFTQREQLLQHFEQCHMKVEEAQLWSKVNVLNRWSCSSCPEILAKDEIEMLSHLTSQGHCKMEAAISKSIPIILRKVSLRSCLFCVKSFVLNRELASHIQQAHHEHRKIVTNISMNAPVDSKSSAAAETQCSKIEPDYSNGAPHVNVNLNLNPLKKVSPECHICSKTFSQVSSLNRHMAHAHHPDGNIYKCNVCAYTTNKSSHLKRHSKQHSKNREKLFHCEICSSSFFETYELENHKKIHFKKTVACKHPGCQFLGRNKSEVDTHKLRHTNDKKLTCDKCDYSSNSKFCFTRHVRLTHGKDGVKQYTCKLCSYSTKLYNCLKRHELQHNEEKSFHCPHCLFSSKTLENLRIHVVRRKIHLGRFLYNCGTCQPVGLEKITFATNSFSDFKHHVTESHSDEPFTKSDIELLVIAGIKKTESVKVTDNQLVYSEIQESKAIYEGSQKLGDKKTDFGPEKDSYRKDSDIDTERFIADSTVEEEKRSSDINKLDEFSSRNSSVDDMFIDELYGNLLIVSDEELQFANVKDTI